jgi:hypothetical protein
MAVHSGKCSALTLLPNRTSAEPGVWAMTTRHDTNEPWTAWSNECAMRAIRPLCLLVPFQADLLLSWEGGLVTQGAIICEHVVQTSQIAHEGHDSYQGMCRAGRGSVPAALRPSSDTSTLLREAFRIVHTLLRHHDVFAQSWAAIMSRKRSDTTHLLLTHSISTCTLRLHTAQGCSCLCV